MRTKLKLAGLGALVLATAPALTAHADAIWRHAYGPGGAVYTNPAYGHSRTDRRRFEDHGRFGDFRRHRRSMFGVIGGVYAGAAGAAPNDGYNNGDGGQPGDETAPGYAQPAPAYAPAPQAYSQTYSVPTVVYRPVTQTYTVPVRTYRIVQRTRYVPVTSYQAVTTNVQVPVTSYQTYQRTVQVPETVYRQVRKVCSCSYSE